MTRDAYFRLKKAAAVALAGCLLAATAWNIICLLSDLGPWWAGAFLPLAGLAGWSGVLAAPLVLARSQPRRPHVYRLFYLTAESWSDETLRGALTAFIKAGLGLDIIWARQDGEIGCWLAVAQSGAVLEKLVREAVPHGVLEPAKLPDVGDGVVVLNWTEAPSPLELCRRDGVDGVFFRRRSRQTAVVAVWGPGAKQIEAEVIAGAGQTLLAPPFAGANPWPALPPFPPSTQCEGLSALAWPERLAPALRVGQPALVVGRDAEKKPISFAWPGLEAMRRFQVVGRESERLVASLVKQAIGRGGSVCLFDGGGTMTVSLSKDLMRETATGRVLLLDIERPAQSRFRLNPLWLPADDRPRAAALAEWPAWLRGLGVTVGGLGPAAFHCTKSAVILTALATTDLDIPGLLSVLNAPDALARVDETRLPALNFLDAATQEGLAARRETSRFEANMQLAHLRNRLTGLLALPEYEILWQRPYTDLAEVLPGQSLFWRIPDKRRRLAPFIASQLLALTARLAAWDTAEPLLVVLHALPFGGKWLDPWISSLQNHPQARVVLSSPAFTPFPFAPPTAMLVSRLSKADAKQVAGDLPGVRPADLERLASERFVFKCGDAICTVDA